MRAATTILVLLALLPGTAVAQESSPEEPESTALMIIFDASGSMEKETARAYSRELKVKVAREELQTFVKKLGARPNLQVGLRVFGMDTTKGCKDTQLRRGFGPVDEELVSRIGEMSPAPFGRTPIALSLLLALEDFQKLAEQPRHQAILLITDGVETCEGSVDEAIEKIKKSGVSLKVHIVGYDVFDWSDPGQKKLEEAARSTGGTAVYPKSREELEQDLTQIAKQEKLVPEAAPPPPPPPPPTLLDKLADNIILIGGGAGVLLLLTAAIILRLRAS